MKVRINIKIVFQIVREEEKDLNQIHAMIKDKNLTKNIKINIMATIRLKI